jgi:hypothetical protein
LTSTIKTLQTDGGENIPALDWRIFSLTGAFLITSHVHILLNKMG